MARPHTTSMPLLCAVLALLILCGPSYAQDAVRGTAASSGSETSQPVEPEPARGVVPLKEGQPAPFTGLLVPKERFIQLLEAEIKAEDLDVKYKAQLRLTKQLEDNWSKRLDEATQPAKWYEEPSANRWFGFVLGVAATALAVYGGTQLVEAAK